MKRAIAALITAVALGASLSACGEVDKGKYEMDCREAGGKVVHVGTQYSCIKDGVKIGEWKVYEDE